MAKKDKTREAQYNETLSGRYGVTLEQCSALGFRFPDRTRAAGFHYALMTAGVEYLLFDATEENVVVVTKPEQAERIRNITDWNNGTEFKPNLKL